MHIANKLHYYFHLLLNRKYRLLINILLYIIILYIL